MGLVVKNLTAKTGDLRAMGLIPESGRGNSNSLQYSYLENPMDREVWGLQSMGSQRVRHDSSDSGHMHDTLARFLYLFSAFS